MVKIAGKFTSQPVAGQRVRSIPKPKPFGQTKAHEYLIEKVNKKSVQIYDPKRELRFLVSLDDEASRNTFEPITENN